MLRMKLVVSYIYLQNVVQLSKIETVFPHIEICILYYYFMTQSVCCIVFQIGCILLLLEANPKAQQTHISSAPMMNFFMKSESSGFGTLNYSSLDCYSSYLIVFFKKKLVILWFISVSSFYADFGPLNLATLYRYCCKLNKKLKVRPSSLNLMAQCLHWSSNLLIKYRTCVVFYL